MKTTKKILLMLTLPLLLSLVSCSDNDDVVKHADMNVTQEITDPTTDQMSVRVTAELPTAVLQNFEQGSTGDALVRRLSQVTTGIDNNTKMVMLPGSLFNMEGTGISEEEIFKMARLYRNGGYIAIVRPTGTQMALFSLALMAASIKIEQDETQEIFDLPEELSARGSMESLAAERIKTRQANISRIAQTRGSDNLDDVWAEMVIMGPTDYFMQDPFEEEFTSYVNNDDTTEPVAKTSTQKRTDAISGTLADVAAAWLNDTEKENEPTEARRHTATRAGGSAAINELMDASETFTFNGNIYFTSWVNQSCRRNRVNMKVSSWGVHNMESNKDYYYLKQNVTLRMGNEDGYQIYYPLAENLWYKTTNFDNYTHWFGAFLSRYDTSMDLSGSGTIHLEASAPNTDNNTSSTTITTGSSSSTTVTNGWSWNVTAGFNMTGPMGSVSIGTSHSVGTTTGSSFSMGMTQTNKELSVKRNTSGTKVSWTYTGTLPQLYENRQTAYICHQQPADILVNDCDVAEEICWSVDNPSGQYTVGITSEPQTACLLYLWTGHWDVPHGYIYNSDGAANYTHTLIEPNRAMQTWRMNITIDEWEGTPIAGALGELTSNIRDNFPDLYSSVFKIADRTPTSLNTISAIVSYTKQVMGHRIDILQSYAKSWGIKQFTIHWTCDDLNVKTREGFVVKVE